MFMMVTPQSAILFYPALRKSEAKPYPRKASPAEARAAMGGDLGNYLSVIGGKWRRGRDSPKT
jgi:hypothetical protein